MIYPVTLKSPFDAQVGKINVRNMTFPLEGDLDEAGALFLSNLLGMIGWERNKQLESSLHI